MVGVVVCVPRQPHLTNMNTWVRSQPNIPYGIPRYETREDAYNAYQSIPQRNTSCVIDNYTFMQSVILKFVVTQNGEECIEKLTVLIPSRAFFINKIMLIIFTHIFKRFI